MTATADRDVRSPSDDDLHICEWCGMEIDEPDQDCPALTDGRCRV